MIGIYCEKHTIDIERNNSSELKINSMWPASLLISGGTVSSMLIRETQSLNTANKSTICTVHPIQYR